IWKFNRIDDITGIVGNDLIVLRVESFSCDGGQLVIRYTGTKERSFNETLTLSNLLSAPIAYPGNSTRQCCVWRMSHSDLGSNPGFNPRFGCDTAFAVVFGFELGLCLALFSVEKSDCLLLVVGNPSGGDTSLNPLAKRADTIGLVTFGVSRAHGIQGGKVKELLVYSLLIL